MDKPLSCRRNPAYDAPGWAFKATSQAGMYEIIALIPAIPQTRWPNGDSRLSVHHFDERLRIETHGYNSGSGSF